MKHAETLNNNPDELLYLGSVPINLMYIRKGNEGVHVDLPWMH